MAPYPEIFVRCYLTVIPNFMLLSQCAQFLCYAAGLWCSLKIGQYEHTQTNMVSRTGLVIVWCYCDVINNSKIFRNNVKMHNIKLLTSQANFQSDQDYFQCPAVESNRLWTVKVKNLQTDVCK